MPRKPNWPAAKNTTPSDRTGPFWLGWKTGNALEALRLEPKKRGSVSAVIRCPSDFGGCRALSQFARMQRFQESPELFGIGHWRCNPRPLWPRTPPFPHRFFRAEIVCLEPPIAAQFRFRRSSSV